MGMQLWKTYSPDPGAACESDGKRENIFGSLNEPGACCGGNSQLISSSSERLTVRTAPSPPPKIPGVIWNTRTPSSNEAPPIFSGAPSLPGPAALAKSSVKPCGRSALKKSTGLLVLPLPNWN